MNVPTTNQDTEGAILARMAESRIALLDAANTPVAVLGKNGRSKRSAANFMAALADAPRVRLILLLSAGAVVFAARRTLGLLQANGRSGNDDSPRPERAGPTRVERPLKHRDRPTSAPEMP